MRTCRVALLIVAVSVATGCSSSPSSSPSTTFGTTSAEPPSGTAIELVSDSIPRVNLGADRGCVDQSGTLRALAQLWYPGSEGGPVSLGGVDPVAASATDPFQAAAARAVNTAASAFVPSYGYDFHQTIGGCVTHRIAAFRHGSEQILVGAWRVESAADPFWIPNDAPFTKLNDSTLVSEGPHLVVVLVVAPDGTTGFASAYGARADQMVAGWPSTIAPLPSSPDVGPVNFTAAQLVPIAQVAVDEVLVHR